MIDDGRLAKAKRDLAKAYPEENLAVSLGEEDGKMAVVVRAVRKDGSAFTLTDSAPYLPEDLVEIVGSLLRGQ